MFYIIELHKTLFIYKTTTNNKSTSNNNIYIIRI